MTEKENHKNIDEPFGNSAKPHNDLQPNQKTENKSKFEKLNKEYKNDSEIGKDKLTSRVGRPRFPEQKKKKKISVTLSRENLNNLNYMQNAWHMTSKSELLDKCVRDEYQKFMENSAR